MVANVTIIAWEPDTMIHRSTRFPSLWRLVVAGLACLLAAPLPSPAEDATPKPDGARALFDAMERRILDSQTLRCELAVTLHRGQAGDSKGATERDGEPSVKPAAAPSTSVNLNGKLLIGDGNRLLLQLDGRRSDQPEGMRIAADGRTMRAGSTSGGQATSEAPRHLTPLIKAALSRSGVFVPFFTVDQREPAAKTKGFDIDSFSPVAGFRSGGKELLEKIETQVVEYDLRLPAAATAPFHVKLWIDPATSLPVKRLVALDAPKVWSVMEIYSDFRLGDPIEDREFATEP